MQGQRPALNMAIQAGVVGILFRQERQRLCSGDRNRVEALRQAKPTAP